MEQNGTTVRTPIVWLVNEGGHDYSSLSDFGRMMPLTRGQVNPFALDRHMVLIGPRLQTASEDDFLAISGLPSLNALVLVMWLTKFPQAKLLIWSVKAGKYLPITLMRSAVQKNSLESGKPAE